MKALPVELWLEVFVKLDPDDLDVIPQVCRKWRQICSEQVWRGVFEQRFGSVPFSPISLPFSWRREVVERCRSLRLWNKKHLGNMMYFSSAGELSCSAPDWDRRLLVTTNQLESRSCVVDLAIGAWERNSQSYWIHTHEIMASASAASKFGLLQGFREGYAFYSPVGSMSQLLQFGNDEPVTACWVSPLHKPSNRSNNYALALGTKSLWLFQGPASLPRKIELGEQITHIALVDGNFVVATSTSVWWVDAQYSAHKLCSMVAFDLIPTASTLLIAGPTLVQVEWKTKELRDLGPCQTFAYDENLLALYLEDTISVYAHKDMALLWSQPAPKVTKIQFNGVVLVAAGDDRVFHVYNLLTGEVLAPKVTEPSARITMRWTGERSATMVHVAPGVEPRVIVVMGSLLSVYGARLEAKPKPKKSSRGRVAAKQPEVDEQDIEEHMDYHSRRINTQNLANFQGMAEPEQLQLAVTMSETTLPPGLTEDEEMALALQESADMSFAQSFEDEDEELNRVLEMSLRDQ